MNIELKSNVTSLSEEKYTALAEQSGWPLVFAEGYVNGQVERRRGNPLTSYLNVGVDLYALGFRAGYFGRTIPERSSLGNTNAVAIADTESMSVV